MKNEEVANVLYEIADILDILKVQWKPVAYRRAARIIESLPERVSEIYKKEGLKGLDAIEGVGEGISKKIAELLRTGKIKELQRLKNKIPKSVSSIMHIEGMGPKKAWKLYQKLKIDSVAKLKKAAQQGKIAKIPGFGKKSEQAILLNISLSKKSKGRLSLREVLPIAKKIVSHLRKSKAVQKIDIAGSLRRKKATIRDIDILVQSKKPEAVMKLFTTFPGIDRVLAQGRTKASIVLKKLGLHADLRIVEAKSYGAALNYFTGPKDHNIRLRQLALKKGWTLSEYGLFTVKGHKYLAGRTEKKIYKKLGVPYKKPGARE